MSAPASGSVYSNPNGMPFADGKNLHMDLGRGDINNRIVTVGTASRAEKIAAHFDKVTSRIQSGRGFLTINGLYQDIPVSVVAIGMGPSMMDFFVREVRAVTDGAIVCSRFGTCGGITEKAIVGSVVVASGGSGYVTRNPDAFAHNYDETSSADSASSLKKYNMAKVAPADARLSAAMEAELGRALHADELLMTDRTAGDLVSSGTNVTAESFYSSQGRIDDEFDDGNETIIDEVCAFYPDARTMEMETFQLFHLAKCSKQPFIASAAAIVVANRANNSTVSGERLSRVEEIGGRATLHAVATLDL
jgi:uridine phosphorylase